MADDKYRLLPLSLAEWENKMRERQEEEAERERVDPVLARINAWADALQEEARIAAIKLEEESAHQAIAEAQRIASEHARAVKNAKAATPEAIAAKAAKRAREIERLAPAVTAACAAAGVPPAGTHKRADQIRPHLPKEEQGLSGRILEDALRAARRAQKKKN